VLKRFFIVCIMMLVVQGCGGKSKEELYAEGLENLKNKNPGAAVVLFKSALEKDQNYIDARYQLAKAFANQGKTEQAEKEFLKVLTQNPTRDDVNLDLARLYNGSKRAEEAFKLAEAYLAKHPNHAESYEIQGISCAVRELYQDAESYLEKAIQADPANQKFPLELAGVYLAGKQEQKARDLLGKAITADAKNTRAHYMLASLEQRANNPVAALDIYRKITAIDRSETQATYRAGLIYVSRNELDKADALADGLIKEFPKRADGFRLKGIVQYQGKQYAEAMASLQNALKLTATLDTYYYLGLASYHRGELEGALSHFRKILDHAPASRQARLMTGVVLLAQKRVDDAITEISKLTRQDENDAEAYSLLGSAYMAKGMFEDGMQALNKATRINPKIADAHVKKGQYYFSKGKFSEGEAELATAVQVAPDKLANRLMLASTYVRSGKTLKAFDLLKAGLQGTKDDAPLYDSMATVLFLQKKKDEGLNYLQKAKQVDPTFAPAYQHLATFHAVSGQYDKAVQEYQALLKQSPGNLQAQLQLAALYDVSGKDAEALAQYQKARESKAIPAFLAEAHYHLKKRQADKALSLLDEALKLEARNAPVLELKGRVLMGEKKFKDALKTADELEAANGDAGIALKIQTYMAMQDSGRALEQARRIIAKYPNSTRGYTLLASIHEFKKDYSAAITEMKKGIQANPKDLQARVYLGNLHAANKEHDAAMKFYNEVLQMNRQFVPALFAQGVLLQQTGKTKEAVDRYRAAVDVSDRYVPALNNLAYLCAEGFCSKEESLQLAMKAFKLEPGNAGIMDTLGYALLKNGRHEDARKVLEKTATLLPNNPSVQYHLGLAYKLAGNKQQAVQTLKKSLTLGAFADAEAARALLQEVSR
jgi:putative PEP-CTERM system TPR-repeat lipoprotein